jgi:hypothetical protein
MSRFLPFVLLSLLAGCYSDQKQQLSACQLQAKQQTDAGDGSLPQEVRDRESTEYIELCMRAQGYEFVQDNCPRYIPTNIVPKADPDYGRSLTEEQQRQHYIEVGIKIIAIAQIQKIEPTCYEPMGWFGKRILRYEKWLGTAQSEHAE